MAATLEAWTAALLLAGVSVGLAIALRLTRKPLAVVRFDGGEHVLSVTSGEGLTRIELGQPFRLRSDLKVPLLPRRQTPWMVVTLEQGRLASRRPQRPGNLFRSCCSIGAAR